MSDSDAKQTSGTKLQEFNVNLATLLCSAWPIVPPDARGRRVVRPDRAYRCGYEVEWPPLPLSVSWFHLPDPKSQGVWKGAVPSALYGKRCNE